MFGIARLAGIMAAKRTPDLIPLSHPLAIHNVTIDFELNEPAGLITARRTVRAYERTGVEMEAMIGASLAALTIYDMCKGSDKSITIGEIKLLFKEGGKSGTFNRNIK
jgi:cyclic pyranopterin phosphate synthase